MAIYAEPVLSVSDEEFERANSNAVSFAGFQVAICALVGALVGFPLFTGLMHDDVFGLIGVVVGAVLGLLWGFANYWRCKMQSLAIRRTDFFLRSRVQQP